MEEWKGNRIKGRLFNFYRKYNDRNTKFEKSLLNGKNCMVMQ